MCCQGSKLYRSGEDQHRRIDTFTSKHSLINGKDTQNGSNININASNSGHFRNKTKKVVHTYTHTCTHTRMHVYTHACTHTHFFFFHYVLSVFPHHQLLGLLLSKNGHGIFNMHNHLQNVCWAHKSVTGTGDSAQVLTEKNWKSVFHPSHPNPWLLDLQPKASASQPQTPTGLHTVHKFWSSSFHCLNPYPES